MSDRLPDRPPRAYVTLWAIATHWADRGGFWVELDYPACFGCGKAPEVADDDPESMWNASSCGLERAHLADRVFGGLDQVQNIVALCGLCHWRMPSFTDGHDAIRWVQGGGHQQVTRPKLDKLTARFRSGDLTLTEYGTKVGALYRMRPSAAIRMVTEAMPKEWRTPRRQAAAPSTQDALF